MTTSAPPLDRVARLLALGPSALAQAAGLPEFSVQAALRGAADVAAVQRLLEPLGLQLAIVPQQDRPLQIPDRDVLLAAMRRAREADEPELGLQARFARLLGVDGATVTKVLGQGASLGSGARERLHTHMLEPGAYPLPPAAPMGRPKKNDDP